ncbi:MAG: M17 family metallopeptidase [Pseudobdellovibrionaceae bacterium]
MVQKKGFQGNKGQFVILTTAAGLIRKVMVGISTTPDSLGLSGLAVKLREALKHSGQDVSFELQIKGRVSQNVKERLYLSWAMGAYQYVTYKAKDDASAYPVLIAPSDINDTCIMSKASAFALLRDMINTPANDLGPAEIAATVEKLAKHFKADFKVHIEDTEKEYPLVHAVGKASTEAPRVIELTWGKKTDPKLAIVGKGVAFDTGGLDIKPSTYMALMKKDMGGAAHALALASIIMANALPVRLHLVIPAVENAIAGNAFRPGDVYKSRKGITVENTNTDAEGRLILADALALACENDPEMLIDFATLTGSARAALGQVIPPFFCTDTKEGQKLQDLSFKLEDPVWQMPLYAPYKKIIESDIADLVNSAGTPGDLIYSALFLQQFVTDKPLWMHFDIFAWEPSGKAGKSKGGTEMTLHTLYAYLEKRYAAS